MCDPVSAGFAILSAGASFGASAKNAHDTRKANREAAKVQEKADARQRALLAMRGADAVKRVDTAAADEERKRRLAVTSNNALLTSRQGALGTPNTASTALSAGATRTTMG